MTFPMIVTALTLALSSPAAAQTPHAMEGGSHGAGHGTMTTTQKQAAIAATGTVNKVDAAKRTITVTHQPIQALGWPQMTMDFAVADGIDLTAVQPGVLIEFTLDRGADGIYRIEGLTRK